MGSQKKEAILQAKWAVNFVKKAKWAKNDYMAVSEDVPTDINPVAWWKSHAMELPKWANAFRLSAAIIFGGLPETLCYVAIQPCSLDSLIFACTLITEEKKKEFLESKMGERESKMGESEKQNR